MNVKTENEQHIIHECTRLIANAIIYFNADLLSRLLEHGDPNGLFEMGKLGKISRSLGNISTSMADLSLTILPQHSILTNSSDWSTWRKCSMRKAKGKKEGWKSCFEPYRGWTKKERKI